MRHLPSLPHISFRHTIPLQISLVYAGPHPNTNHESTALSHRAMANKGVCEAQLRLQWVYGYRGYQGCNNVVVNSKTSLVYYVAAVGIVQSNGPKPTQQFYGQHTDDIIRYFASATRASLLPLHLRVDSHCSSTNFPSAFPGHSSPTKFHDAPGRQDNRDWRS